MNKKHKGGLYDWLKNGPKPPAHLADYPADLAEFLKEMFKPFEPFVAKPPTLRENIQREWPW